MNLSEIDSISLGNARDSNLHGEHPLRKNSSVTRKPPPPVGIKAYEELVALSIGTGKDDLNSRLHSSSILHNRLDFVMA
jgi:hypothetical protein